MTEMTADEAIEEALRDLEFGPDSYVEMVEVFKRALLRHGFVVKEAVPGGNACHSVEQHMPETTPKGEQQS